MLPEGLFSFLELRDEIKLVAIRSGVSCLRRVVLAYDGSSLGSMTEYFYCYECLRSITFVVKRCESGTQKLETVLVCK